ncbi:hypothetical protein ABK040_011538 [Willaertia magna]
MKKSLSFLLFSNNKNINNKKKEIILKLCTQNLTAFHLNSNYHYRSYHSNNLKFESTSTTDTTPKVEIEKSMIQSVQQHRKDESTQQQEHKFTNRLAKEASPYLLQHAHNPVDWYPWGEEAFQKAKQEDKPIFLSVGYSTCHWCHVMEKESFESEQIAKIMNEHFVNIKVDREERPDVDRVYMTYVQVSSGHGGWPMSVFLTPDLKPIYGGTYFPAEASPFRGGISFPMLLHRITSLWKEKRDVIEEQSDKMMNVLQTAFVKKEDKKGHESLEDEVFGYGDEHFKTGVNNYLDSFDSRYGGFSGAPKFPQPVIFNLLFRGYFRETDENKKKQILEECLFTLRQMAKGGMYDQLGGGFHRYSVDEEWHVPHFEKMLYDQGQLAVTYIEAYQITKDEFYSNIAKEIFTYILRDMTIKESDQLAAFYSAEDADSFPTDDSHEKKEGAFYSWDYHDLVDCIEENVKIELENNVTPADVFCYMFDVKEKGNVKGRSDPHGELRGLNVLIQRNDLEATSKKFNIPKDKLQSIIDECRKALFLEREKRPRPHLDDKVITSWNGYMISAFAKASQVLFEPLYAEHAEKAANFILENLYDKERKILFRSYRKGSQSARIEGFLSDYANFIAGLLDLYEATGNLKWLTYAIDLTQKQKELFYDPEGKGFYEESGRDKTILLRLKEVHDGAEPSGNSITAMNLLRLMNFDVDRGKEYEEMVKGILLNNSKFIMEHQEAVPQLMCALDECLNPGKHIALVYDNSVTNLAQVQSEIHGKHNPSKSIVFINKDDKNCMDFIQKHIPYLSDTKVLQNKTTIYICQNFSCQAPTTSFENVQF